MTDTQYETIDEPAPHPQVNKVRGEYVDGEMSEADLEAQLERSLLDGPDIGSQAVSGTELGTFDRAKAYAQVPGILLLLVFINQLDGGHGSYDVTKHTATIRDSDPDPDSHPAQSAGTARAFLYFLPVVLNIALLALLAANTSPASTLASVAVLLSAGLGILTAMAPYPTVRYTVEGVGTHVAD